MWKIARKNRTLWRPLMNFSMHLRIWVRKYKSWWMPLRKFCHIGKVTEVNTSGATAVSVTDVGNPRISTLKRTSIKIRKFWRTIKRMILRELLKKQEDRNYRILRRNLLKLRPFLVWTILSSWWSISFCKVHLVFQHNEIELNSVSQNNLVQWFGIAPDESLNMSLMKWQTLYRAILCWPNLVLTWIVIRDVFIFF